MLPEVWGPWAWKFLHTITLDYPEYPTDSDRQSYYQYFHSLQYVLPCEKCRMNLKHHLNKYPLNDEVLSSRNNLVKWGIDLHNVVNHYLGKPMLSYKQALNDIKHFSQPPRRYAHWIIIIVTVLIVIGLIGYICYKYK